MSKQSWGGKIRALFAGANSDLEQIRAEIGELKRQREEVINTSLPKAEALERLVEFVDSEADSFGAEYRFLNAAATPDAAPQDIGAFEIGRGDTGPLLCWLFGETIKERLSELVEQTKYNEGIPAAEREAAAAEIDRRLLALETEEEEIITSAETAGMDIPRRGDCDPRIVLEVRS